MKTLVSTALFTLIGQAAQDEKRLFTDRETQSAYDEFVDLLESVCESEPSPAHLLRVLNYTRMELIALQKKLLTWEAKKNVAACLEKTIGMLRNEMRIALQRMEHPVPVIRKPEHVSPSHWKGQVSGLVELISSLDYSGHVVTESGARQSYAALVAGFEWLFNVTIDKPYDQRARLAMRKKRLAILLPELKSAFEKNLVLCNTNRNTK